MKHYYGVEYLSGANTTAGTPNAATGECSIACYEKSFTSKAARDAWVIRGRVTTWMNGNCRAPVSRIGMRNMNKGMTSADFNTYIHILNDGACDD